MHAIKPSFRQSSFARDLAAITVVACLLISKWCGAAEAPKPVKSCSIIYINGDAVITCKRAS